MKKYIVVGLLFLFIAIIIAVGVFFFLSFSLKQNQLPEETMTVPQIETGNSFEKTTSSPAIPLEIPLRNLPISENQKAVLDTVGGDVEKFVITLEMQTCARKKLCEARLAEIIAGASPTKYETSILLQCL